MTSTTTARVGRRCEVCTTTYRATYSGQRTCGRACGVILRYGERTPAVPRQRAMTLVTCRCGTTFLTEQPSAIWCDGCRANGHDRYRPVDDVDRTCPECGTRFLAAFTGGRRKTYCRRECRRAAMRRMHCIRAGRFKVSAAVRASAYRRDQWTCHLCGYLVRPGQPPTDPWAASLDHLTPRSLGGTDDLDNLATAHLWCNVTRGIDPVPSAWPHGAPPPTWGRGGSRL